MTTKEKQVSYQTSNTYSKMNEITAATKNIWFSCHGIGYLSRYFIRYFSGLDEGENCIIAPQAPSKYYQKSDFKYVGASWLTKEKTQLETENVLKYFDAIFKAEEIDLNHNLILFGFSQGVSVSMRWMASRKISCDLLVIYAGKIPIELKPKDFEYLESQKVKLIYGQNDQYFSQDRIDKEIKFAQDLFGSQNVETIYFDGMHEMNSQIIKNLVEV